MNEQMNFEKMNLEEYNEIMYKRLNKDQKNLLKKINKAATVVADLRYFEITQNLESSIDYLLEQIGREETIILAKGEKQ